MSQNSSEELIEVDDLHLAEHTERENEITSLEMQDPNTIVVERDEIGETIDQIVKSGLKITHIYNGMVLLEDNVTPEMQTEPFYGMAEFKIDAPKVMCEDATFKFQFVNSRHKCGWFRVDGGSKRLIGPYIFDGPGFMKTGVRKVLISGNDDGEDESAYHTIENIDNDPENLIQTDDIPPWMMRDVMRGIEVVECTKE